MDRRPKKEKYIPVYGQNVLALPPKPGMEYALDWLTNEKMHKYWPMVSRLSYQQLLALDEATWELTLQSIGVKTSSVTLGAKKRLLRLTKDLRARGSHLKVAMLHGSLVSVVDCVIDLLKTPLANHLELDGEHLIFLIQEAIAFIHSKVTLQCLNNKLLRKIYLMDDLYKSHPSLRFDVD